MANVFFNRAKYELVNGKINWNNDTIKIALMNNSFSTPTASSYDTWSQVSSYECSGTGYTAGGLTLSNKTLTEDDINNKAIADAGDPTWTGINVGTIKGAMIYKSTGTPSTSTLICWIDTGGFPITTNGGDITIQFNASGIFNLIDG